MDREWRVQMQALDEERRAPWTPKSIIVPAELRDGTGNNIEIKSINLIDYIGDDSPMNKTIKTDHCAKLQGHGAPIVFPSIRNWGAESRDEITRHLVRACASEEGFALVCKGWERQRNRVVYKCARGKLHQAHDNKYDEKAGEWGSQVRRTKTALPTLTEDLCGFHFSFRFNHECRYWYFVTGTGSRAHENHIQKRPGEIRSSFALMRDKEHELARSTVSINAPPQAVQALMQTHTGLSLSSRQIEHLARKMRDGDAVVESGSRGQTAADKLLEYLRGDSSISFVAVYDDDPESSLLSVKNKGRPKRSNSRKKRKSPVKHHSSASKSRIFVAVRESGVDEEEQLVRNIDTAIWNDEVESAEQYATRVRKQMKLGNGKLLLAVAWATDDERRLFGCFPEFVAGDVTLQTNTEKRPLFQLAGKTGANKTFTALKAYLPSEGKWVFNWLWSTALPRLHMQSALDRVRLCLTDGDEKEYIPLEDAIESGVLYGCQHALCVWHKINRGMKAKKLFRPSNSILGKAYFDVLERWLWSWTDSIESELEFQHSFGLMNNFLEDESVESALGTGFVHLFREFVETSMLSTKRKWLFAARLNVRCGNERTTSIAESENACMKNSCLGPKPYQSIQTSAKAITDLHRARVRINGQDSAVALDHMPTSGYKGELESDLTEYAARLIRAEWESRINYGVYRRSQTTFYVKQKSFKAYSATPGTASYKYHMVPSYERTRVVTTNTGVDRKVYLTCTCGGWERCGAPCRHMWRILDRHPISSDVVLRFHKSFEYFYLRDEAYTKLFDSIIQHEPSGVPFHPDENAKWVVGTISDSMCVNDFRKTIPDANVPLVTPSNAWRAPSKTSTLTNPIKRIKKNIPIFAASMLPQEIQLSQAASKANSNDGAAAQEEELARSAWRRPDTSTFAMLSPQFQELCNIGDDSFEANQFIRDRLLELLPQAHAVAQAAKQESSKYKQAPRKGSESDSKFVSSNVEMDCRRRSKRLSGNPFSPVRKKR